MRVAVVGAGVVGLAAASELMRAGAEVRCYEKAEAGSGQSKGKTRIFRLAHGDARLVRLAMRARRGWRAWENRHPEGTRRRLVGTEGLILTGEDLVSAWQRAMAEAGAEHRPLTAAECRRLLPIVRLPACPTLFDPEGGATRARRTIDFLRQEVGERLQMTEVLDLEEVEDGCVVHTAGGRWTCDEVVIAAGIDTSRLAGRVGLDVPLDLRLHSRFTFEVREEYARRPLSCWIDDSGLVGDGWTSYCQPVGTTGRYAVGVSWEGQRDTADVGAEEVSRQSREVAVAYVREVLPGLHPEPVEEVRCTFNEIPFLDRGDGFVGCRREHVTAIYGSNLFKFAPLLGELIREAVMEGGLPAELRMFSPERPPGKRMANALPE